MNNRQIKKYLKKQKKILEDPKTIIQYWDTFIEIKVYEVDPEWNNKQTWTIWIKNFMDKWKLELWLDYLLEELMIK